MATISPKFGVGDSVYFKESAALGFIEATRVSGVHLGQNGWLYTTATTLSPPSPGAYQDRRSLVGTQILYYTEDELCDKCEALILAEANAKRNYDRIKAQRQAICPDSPTETG
jgi:hypothetical protein